MALTDIFLNVVFGSHKRFKAKFSLSPEDKGHCNIEKLCIIFCWCIAYMFTVERNTCLGMPKYRLFSFFSNVYLYKSLNLRLSRIVDIKRECWLFSDVAHFSFMQ